MKINIFTPLPPAKSDIANFSIKLLPHLQAHAEVKFWTSQKTWDRAINKVVDVGTYDPMDVSWAELHRADATVYNIGNNMLYHSDIWEVSRKLPGIVILHDRCLHHLFLGYYQDRNDRAGYLQAIFDEYGINGQQHVSSSLENDFNLEVLATKYPLTMHGVQGCYGVVVHSQENFEQFKGNGMLPVQLLHLLAPSSTQYSKRDYNVPPFKIIVFGFIGTNRRIPEILEALSVCQAKDHFRLHIYGDLLEKDFICKLVQDKKLDNIVKLHGYVSTAELDDALSSAHLAINLRYPSMGEASGSQLRIWDHSLPSLVTKTGWYAELPVDTVAFVSPENEVEDILRHLQVFLENPLKFSELGINGRRCLETRHSPESYAQGLVEFCSHVGEFRRRLVADHLCSKVGREMAIWLPTDVKIDMMSSVAQQILSL